MSRVSFEVVGSPAAQGSKKHVGNGVMVETAKGHKPWRAAVAEAARAVAPDVPMTGPLFLSIAFRFPMPASRPKRVRALGIARKTTAPDLDKLIRCVGDALKEGGLIHDDALFCRIEATKHEVLSWTGAAITVISEAAA